MTALMMLAMSVAMLMLAMLRALCAAMRSMLAVRVLISVPGIAIAIHIATDALLCAVAIAGVQAAPVVYVIFINILLSHNHFIFTNCSMAYCNSSIASSVLPVDTP